MIFDKKVLDIIPADQIYPLERVIQDLIQRREISAFEATERFYEIGSPNGMDEFKKYIQKKRGKEGTKMIISRAPVRISLGGGGTDLKSYYSKHGGFLIAGAIDKYVFISANKRFQDTIRLSYSQTEIVNNIGEIKHAIFREALNFVTPHNGDGIELVSIADVPANCGLGSSSSFTVSLLNALHAYNREYISQQQLAEEACAIEIEKLGAPIGKQDQYISAFGGITTLTFEKDGKVIVEPVNMKDDAIDELERNTLLYYTGIERSASDILKEQNEKSKKDESAVIESLHQIKKIGYETKKAFEKPGTWRNSVSFSMFTGIIKSSFQNMFPVPSSIPVTRLQRKTGLSAGKLWAPAAEGSSCFMLRRGMKS